jgi:hypothetical protein
MPQTIVSNQPTIQPTPKCTYPGQCDDCPGRSDPLCCRNTEDHTPQPTVPGQPWRTMSTVERDLPPWLKAAMNGKSRNGTFSGRGK